MRLTSENKKKITDKVRAAAAKVFRAKGYDAVTLDMLMHEAGLTRGAFYAHYKSKAAVFADVMRAEHPVLTMLVQRDGETARELHQQMMQIFRDYLTHAHLEEVFCGCTLASLTGDATRANDDVRTGFGMALDAILAEMARGQGRQAGDYASALILSAGAVRTARAVTDDKQQEVLLSAALAGFQKLLPDPITASTA